MLFSVRRFIEQLFICVIFDKHNFIIRAHSIKNNKFIQTYEKTFDTRIKALEYIKNLNKDYQIYYCGILYSSIVQGLAPTQNIKELTQFGINLKNVKTISIANTQIYASNQDLEELKNEFSEYGGLDFVFSPLALLHFIASKQNLKSDKITLCVYRHSDLVAMMVFKGKEVLFGSFFDIAPRGVDFQSEPGEENAGMEEFNSQDTSFEDLEGILDEKLDDIKYANTNDDLSNFGHDMQMSTCVFKGIEEFYNNDLYKGTFIDEMIIFDNEHTSEAALEYIESEIFLKPQLIQVDSLELMNMIMQKELKII